MKILRSFFTIMLVQFALVGAILSLTPRAHGQPTPTPTTGSLTVNTTTSAITAPGNATRFASANSLLTTTGAAAAYQPLDSDLTAIAALTTTANGRSLLTLASVPSGALVGTSDTQTLTNKTLTAPILGAATATSITGQSAANLTLAGGSGGGIVNVTTELQAAANGGNISFPAGGSFAKSGIFASQSSGSLGFLDWATATVGFTINTTTGAGSVSGTFSSGDRMWIGSSSTVRSVNPNVSANRTLTGSGNAHGFSEQSEFAKSAGTAFAAFDGRFLVSGTANYDHFVSFQAAPTLSTSGTTTYVYGAYLAPTLTAGTITNNVGLWVQDPVVSGGSITNNYGIFIGGQTAGANNYAVYTTGSAPSRFGGEIRADSAGSNLSMAANGTTVKSGLLAANNSGYVYLTDYATVAKGIRVDVNSGGAEILGGGLRNESYYATHSTTSGYYSGVEQSSSPAAPPTNGWRIYAKDNGSGKTVLYVRFATGAEQQIAIEP